MTHPTSVSHRSAELRRFSPSWSAVGVAPMVQLLDEGAQQIEDPDFRITRSPASAVELFARMATIRRFDVEATALQRKGELGLWAPLLGQEAVQVGVAAALGASDHIFPSHREHGLGMLMGLDTERILALFNGSEMGDWDAEEMRFHHYNMVIGAATLHAVGYAMAQARCAGDGGLTGATVVFHGDGAISEGDVNEAYVFAASYRAPVVFVCVNNQWAISEPVARQSRIPLHQRAWGYGIPSVRVDGNDVLAMEEVSRWALEHAHSGRGPIFIEAVTYRMGAHTTSDDPTKYRTVVESDSWAAKDPLIRMRSWLEDNGVWGEAEQARLDQDLEECGVAVRNAVGGVRVPGLEEIFDRVYADQAINDCFDRVI